MVVASWLPEFKLGPLTFKRTNILADIFKQRESPELLEEDLYFDTTFLSEATAMKVIDSATRNAIQVLPEAEPEEWDIAPPILLPRLAGADQVIVPIESFSPEAMTHFNRALTRSKAGRPVRIAVLGDSFIEGDIFTADLREQLQDLCGGRGVGFVPFATPLSNARGTVSHSFSNWDVYNVLDREKIPTEIDDLFFISGLVCIPQEGATSRLQGVTFRKHIKQSGAARLIFTNRNNTQLNVVINDSINHFFTPEPSEHVQQIVINTPPIHSIKVTLDQTDGFIGYGIVLDDTEGVSVDNYSIRGNSGMGLFRTNNLVNQQIGQMLDYDLIVLQYGLNVMIPNVLKYDSYSKTFTQVIHYVQQCFPNASILVMGVGDRSTLHNGQFETMPAVKGIIDAQREAAQSAGVAFWNTFDAMGGENSMVDFVQKKWAAKDHTHIRYLGGKYIAQQLAAALVDAANQYLDKKAEEMRFYRYSTLEADKNLLPSGLAPERKSPNPSRSHTETKNETGLGRDQKQDQTTGQGIGNENSSQTGTESETGVAAETNISSGITPTDPTIPETRDTTKIKEVSNPPDSTRLNNENESESENNHNNENDNCIKLQ